MLSTHNKATRHSTVITSIVEDKALWWFLRITDWVGFIVTAVAVGGIVSVIVLIAFPLTALPVAIVGLVVATVLGVLAGSTVVKHITPSLTKKTPLRGVLEAIWSDFTAPRGAREVTLTVTPSRRATSWDTVPTPETVVTARPNVHTDE